MKNNRNIYVVLVAMLLIPAKSFTQNIVQKDTVQVNVEGIRYNQISSSKGGTILRVENAENYLSKSGKEWCYDAALIDPKKSTLNIPAVASIFSLSRLKEVDNQKIILSLNVDRQGDVKEIIFHFHKDMFLTMEEVCRLEQVIKKNIKFPYIVSEEIQQMCEYATYTAPVVFSDLLKLK